MGAKIILKKETLLAIPDITTLQNLIMCTLRPQTNTLEPQWQRIANSLVSTQGKLKPVLEYYILEADNLYKELEWDTLPPALKYQEEVRERLQLLLPSGTAERELNPTTSS